MDSIALYVVYFLHVFPPLCPTGNTTSQGRCELKKTLTDSLKTVPMGRSHGERLSLADSWQRRSKHSLWGGWGGW